MLSNIAYNDQEISNNSKAIKTNETNITDLKNLAVINPITPKQYQSTDYIDTEGNCESFLKSATLNNMLSNIAHNYNKTNKNESDIKTINDKFDNLTITKPTTGTPYDSNIYTDPHYLDSNLSLNNMLSNIAYNYNKTNENKSAISDNENNISKNTSDITDLKNLAVINPITPKQYQSTDYIDTEGNCESFLKSATLNNMLSNIAYNYNQLQTTATQIDPNKKISVYDSSPGDEYLNTRILTSTFQNKLLSDITFLKYDYLKYCDYFVNFIKSNMKYFLSELFDAIYLSSEVNNIIKNFDQEYSKLTIITSEETDTSTGTKQNVDYYKMTNYIYKISVSNISFNIQPVFSITIQYIVSLLYLNSTTNTHKTIDINLNCNYQILGNFSNLTYIFLSDSEYRSKIFDYVKKYLSDTNIMYNIFVNTGFTIFKSSYTGKYYLFYKNYLFEYFDETYVDYTNDATYYGKDITDSNSLISLSKDQNIQGYIQTLIFFGYKEKELYNIVQDIESYLIFLINLFKKNIFNYKVKKLMYQQLTIMARK